MKLVSFVVTLALALTPAFAQADAAKKKADAAVTDAKKKVETKAADAKKTTDDAKKTATDTKKKVDAKVDDAKKTADTKTVAKKAPAAPAGGPININTATKAQLQELPGVGEANADHIIKGRPYKSGDELISRKIIQQRYYDQFKSMITTK